MTIKKVDQASRLQALRLLEEIIRGQITNYQFEDRWPEETPDPVLPAIFGEVWRYYNDYPEAPMSVTTLNSEQVQVIKRCTMFLRSDYEYRWPKFNFMTGNVKWYHWLFGRRTSRMQEELQIFKAVGCIDVWPFFEMTEYEHVEGCEPER